MTIVIGVEAGNFLGKITARIFVPETFLGDFCLQIFSHKYHEETSKKTVHVF